MMEKVKSETTESPGEFPTTRWSYVSLLRQARGDHFRDLLEPFLTNYLPALSEFLRLGMRVHDPHVREDLLQGFIADRMIANSILLKARSERGKFRSFVLACLVNYVKDHRKSLASRQNALTLSLNSATYAVTAQDCVHSQVFDVLWAREVTHRALALLREECETSRRLHVWSIFHKRVLEPIETGKPAASFGELANQMRLPQTQAKNYLVTAKRAYKRHLREVIDQYTADRDETNREIENLLHILAMERRHTD